MGDEVLAHLREARAAVLKERDRIGDSRQRYQTLCDIDSAILWRQEDLRLQEPNINECSPAQ